MFWEKLKRNKKTYRKCQPTFKEINIIFRECQPFIADMTVDFGKKIIKRKNRKETEKIPRIYI